MRTGALCAYAICAVAANFRGSYELMMTVLGILMLADTVSGWVKYWRMGKFSSRGIIIGMVTKVMIFMIPVLVHLSLSTIGVSGEGFLKTMMGVFIVAELISFVQNTYIVLTGDDKEEQDVISWALSWTLGKLRAMMNGMTER